MLFNTKNFNAEWTMDYLFRRPKLRAVVVFFLYTRNVPCHKQVRYSMTCPYSILLEGQLWYSFYIPDMSRAINK